MKVCCVCDRKIRKGISIAVTQFNNSKTLTETYDFCPADAPVVAHAFVAEVEKIVAS